MKIHHMGYLVKKIEKALPVFLSLGYEIEQNAVFDEYRQIDIVFLKNQDGYRIELVSPRNDQSVVADLRKKIGNSPYHVCYEVDNLEKTIEELRDLRFVVCQEPHEAVAMNRRRVAFLINSQIGMIELVETVNSIERSALRKSCVQTHQNVHT